MTKRAETSNWPMWTAWGLMVGSLTAAYLFEPAHPGVSRLAGVLPRHMWSEPASRVHADRPVPREVLEAEYHTFIHDLPEMGLSIMPQALLAEPVFARLHKSTESEFHIILLDSTHLDSQKLPEEFLAPEHAKFLAAMRQKEVEQVSENSFDFQQYRDQGQKDYAAEVAGVEKELKEGSVGSNQAQEMKRLLGVYYQPYLDNASPDELAEGMVGYYFDSSSSFRALHTNIVSLPIDPIRRSYVVVATRQSERILAWEKYLDLRYPEFARPAGRVDWNWLLQPSDSFRNPVTFSVDHDEPVYPIFDLNLGIILRHEFGHAAGRSHPDIDYVLLHDLRQAWEDYHMSEAWERHEKGKRSGYYFKFMTPVGDIYS